MYIWVLNRFMQRRQEAIALFYRIGIAYLFFGFSRLLFVYFNADIIQVDHWLEILRLCWLGIRFDSTAILYLLLPFIFLSILPGTFTTSARYQWWVYGLYLFGGFMGLALNFIDFAYYRFNLSRINANFFEVIENEINKTTLFFHFIDVYFYLIVLFIICCGTWIWLYQKITIRPIGPVRFLPYSIESIVFFILSVALSIGGIRGDFKKSTRPIAPIHAMEQVKSPQHADIVLNTPFNVIRTWGKMTLKPQSTYSEDQLMTYNFPFKHYAPPASHDAPPNIVLIILESMGREYWGALNEQTSIPNYESFTPFLDSLAQHSLRFPNFFANSRKSIHGMPAILAGIPSFETAYTSTPFASQKTESVVSIANDLGYDTSFFHGAPNGSMGFLGFAKTLGFDHYYGKNEYNNNADFDGFWGIWDEPFFQFMKKILDQKQEPFFSTLFTISSHEPYIIPKQYEGKFPTGYVPMHQCVGYTDFSLKQFFQAAKKMPWFDNTIFVFTADHGNQSYFPFYEQTINRFANPLMLYDPKGKLKGVDNTLGQHIDIYPTLVDLMHYGKPFRSWGQSLVSPQVQNPFVINYFGSSSYFLMQDGYTLVSNGKQPIGLYHISDYDLKNNLIERDSLRKKVTALNLKLGVFMQDYNNRIVNKKMFYPSTLNAQ